MPVRVKLDWMDPSLPLFIKFSLPSSAGGGDCFLSLERLRLSLDLSRRSRGLRCRRSRDRLLCRPPRPRSREERSRSRGERSRGERSLGDRSLVSRGEGERLEIWRLVYVSDPSANLFKFERTLSSRFFISSFFLSISSCGIPKRKILNHYLFNIALICLNPVTNH